MSLQINLNENGTLYFPEGERAVPLEYMAGREDLRELILPEGVEIVGAGAFAECESLCRVSLPRSIRIIESGAFMGCRALSELTFPEGLEEIGEGAFWGCGLRRVSLPRSVKSIGEHAFWENEELRRADVLNSEARLGKDVFGSCYHLREGYIAPGYPPEDAVDPSRFCRAERGAGELLYSLLWCSCPEKHTAEVTARAEAFIRKNQGLVMEWILRENNTAAMTAIADRQLLDADTVDGYVRAALENRQTELVALLLRAKGQRREKDEFDL